MLAHGHEPVMESNTWMCVSCGMTGPKLLYHTCGHTREGNKRKIHIAMQFGTGNHPKRITTQDEDQWEGDPNWKPFNAEDYGYSRIHFRKHVLWEGPQHIACPRCGRKAKKTTKNMNATWQHECRRPPRPRHDPILENGKWKCRVCQQHGRKLFTTHCEDNDNQHSDDTIQEPEELTELTQRLMKNHEIRESETHYGCIRCGKCVNKYSRHPDRIWRQKCILPRRPPPKHDIQLEAGGWRCKNCTRKGNRLFHTPCQQTARTPSVMHRITRKRPPRPGEPGYGNVKRRIVKKTTTTKRRARVPTPRRRAKHTPTTHTTR